MDEAGKGGSAAIDGFLVSSSKAVEFVGLLQVFHHVRHIADLADRCLRRLGVPHCSTRRQDLELEELLYLT